MNITDNDIKKICSENIYKSGCDYAKEGRVHIRVRGDENIVAAVDSDKIYNVHIGFDENGKISETFCTCPYYQTMSSNCKHIVATLKTRQAEIKNSGRIDDDNDRLALALCGEYETKNIEKTPLMLAFTFNINTNFRRECSYSIIIKNGDSKVSMSSTEGFVSAYLTGEEYKLSKHKAYENTRFSINKNAREVLDILAEAMENKMCSSQFYIQRPGPLEVGALTAKRLIPLLASAQCLFVFNGMPQSNLQIRNEDPDILVDLTATDDNINISVPQSGIAVIPDGSWFLYEGDLYSTSEEWRSWYMPIYRALATQSRTQLDFKGGNAISFASNALPDIKGKKGVIAQGIENVVIDDKPRFNIYLDESDGGIRADITVSYGKITIRLPSESDEQSKIVVRDYGMEEKILAFFENFDVEGKDLYLNDSDGVFEFITEKTAEISKYADVHISDRYGKIVKSKLPSIKSSVKYDKKIDLLEVGFESELSAAEIAGILSAIRNKKKYYKTAEGDFLDLSSDISDYQLIEGMGFSFPDIKEKRKVIPKYYALFLEGARDKIDANEEFDELIKYIRKIKADIPDYLEKVLRNYQKTAVDWLKQLSEMGFGGILADDMGLGKTLEIISFIMSEKSELPTLVVTPSSLIYNWQAEIAKFAPSATVKVIDGTKEDRMTALSEISGNDFVITSYPLLRKDISEYEEKEFFCCVIDEAQHIKNPKTLSSKAVKRIKAKSFFALSGTPVENSLSDLWSIFDFVMPGYLGQHQFFTASYEKPIMHGDDEAADTLRKKIKPFVLRRMKYDVLSELPEKIENTFFAEPTPSQKKVYLSFLAAAKREVREMQRYGADNIRILTLLMRLRQICCHTGLIDGDFEKESGKLILLEDLLVSGISSGHRILVFSQFTSMLAIIKKRLESLEIPCFYLDGNTSSIARCDMADRFNNGEKNVFLISLKAGGTGLNLIGADIVVHYDPWWNPAVVDQASDRAYRIGQTKAVHIIRLATRGTIEEQILKLQEKKRYIVEDMIRTNSDTLSNLTREELMEFFR